MLVSKNRSVEYNFPLTGSKMDTVNGIHIIDCKNINAKPLRDIQDTKEFKTFADEFGNGMKLNGIVYLINTEVGNEVVRQHQMRSLNVIKQRDFQSDRFTLYRHQLSNKS